MDSGALDISRRLAAMLSPADLDATLGAITAAAVEVLPKVSSASITVKHADGRLQTSVPTDERLMDLDAAQYELQQGPCYEAATDTVHVSAPYLASDPRFPQYAPIAISFGIQAQAGIRLFETSTSNGALNLYSEEPGVFQDFEALAELFAHQSGVAIAYARHVGNLESALRSRQVIGQAVGVVMERYQLDDARGFALLARLSSHQNVKLRDVAQRVVDETNKATSRDR